MITFFKNLLGANPDPNVQELLKRGATIIDVRTEREFSTGHLQGSVNIPLDKLQKNASNLKRDKPIITCCASGVRSATAKKILMNIGFSEVCNGGSWANLKGKA
jgi:rhodanese-related sulfurtransferase